jgi:hypothetical protein
MAEYCSGKDVKKRLKDFKIDDIDIPGNIQPLIQTASNIIDARLDHFYSVPFSVPRTDIIHSICVELASALVLETVYQDKSSEQSQVAKEWMERAEGWLEKIRCNLMDVPGETRLA